MDGELEFDEAEMARQGSFRFKQNVLEKEGEREATHKKAFTKWVNSKLAMRSPPMHVNNVITDLQDGRALLCLLEVLTNRKLKKEKGNLRVHKINNVEQALIVLDECKVKLVGINGFDIVDGKTRVILGLLWSIILRFQVQEVMQQAGSEETSRSFTVEKQLLDWCKERLKGYDIKISDFTTSWRDGYAFNAILHSYRKDAFDFESLSRMDERKRLEHAFNQGEKTFGIPRILDASDVYVERPDKKLIILHLSNMYDYLEGSKANDQPNADVEEVVIQVDNNEVESTPSWDELDAASSRSPEDRARAREEIERKLDDLDAAVDDAADRKPISKDSNLTDLETSKIHLDRHKKYMRTVESLDNCKDEVFAEVEQTINEGYCDGKEKETYYERMRQIDDKIKALRNSALKDFNKVTATYNLFLSDKLKAIEESVKNSEKKMKSTKDVANDYDTINKQMEEHQKLQEEMGDPTVVNMILEIDASDPTVDSTTRSKVKSLSQRWKAVWDWAEARKKKLMDSLSNWQKFRDEQLILLNWLGTKEKALKEINETDLMDEEAVDRGAKQLEEILKDLDDEEYRLDHLHDCGEKLKQDAGKGKDKDAIKDIDKQLKDFDDCWNDIVKQVIDGKEKLNNAKNKIKEMKAEMKEVNEWMDEARGLIDEVSEDMSPEDEAKLKDKVEVKCDERPQIQVRVQRVKRLADDVMPMLDPESSKKLEKEVEDFEEKWKETNAALESFSDKGYSDAKNDCCLVRVIKRKFKSTNN